MLILASKSPRRQEILKNAGIEFIIDAADIDENIDISEPEELVKELSYRKAKAVAKMHEGELVLGADTIVVLNDKILGKPADKEEAFEMLSLLSGRTHKVYTGVTLLILPSKEKPGSEIRNTFAECTLVTTYDLEPDFIRSYIDTGEPMDKAGAYGIQEKGALLIKRIEGSYHNVVGLPVAEVFRRLKNVQQLL